MKIDKKRKKTRENRRQRPESIGDIGHNEALGSEKVQKQARSEEIQEAMKMKMDKKRKKARKKSKTKGEQETKARVYKRYWT